ncbi:MAG TPA: diguanylate cyclase [Chloroflexota bacterium]|nr:diguanylate cyclase [Chloroflexota bacterium]
MGFAKLSRPARAYILAVYGLAAAAVAQQGLAVWSAPGSWPWETFAVLTLAAMLAHSFPVSTPAKQAFHVSLPFFIAAIVLLHPLQLTGLMVAVNVAEWLRRRRTWYGQLFNISTYVLVGVAAQGVYDLLGRAAESGPAVRQPPLLLAGAAAVLTYLIANRALISLAIWLANRIPPREQAILGLDGLLTEVILLALGLPLALLTQVGPWALVLGAAPLLLIHRALDLPNIRAQRRQDDLTQLFTRSYLSEACGREIVRAQRFGRPLAMLVIDLDRLGKVNADHGQAAGDAVIQGSARLIGRVTREYDVAARVVGGQFALLLPETEPEAAVAVAERLRRMIAQHRFEVASSLDPLFVTASVGLVAIRGGGPTAEQLFAAAEAAVARAKREGQDRVVVAVAPEGTGAPEPSHTTAPESAAAAPTEAAPSAPPATASAWPPRWIGRPERAAKLFGFAVAAAGLLVLLALAPAAVRLDPAVLLLMAGLVVLAELRRLDLFDRSSFSLANVPVIAAGILLGPAGAAAVAPLSALVRGTTRRTVWYKIAFNAGNYVLAAAAAAAVFRFEPVSVEPSRVAWLVAPAVLAGLVYYLHSVVLAVAVGTELQINPLQLWASQYRWLWWQYVVLSVMALLLALAYSAFGLVGAAAFVVPPLMMRYVAKQYVDRTLEHVRQLRALNEQLQAEIAHRTAAEQESARLAGEAARAAAFEELSRLKSEFISIASHELRTPMATVLGFSELLLDEIEPDDPRWQSVSVIHQDALQLSSLVDNLLDISRIETGRLTLEPTAVDLGDVLPPLMTILGAPAPRHELVAELDPTARWVRADPGKLNQILTNLIGNAVKYSPDGGRVVVRSRRRGQSWVAVSVTDQGVGIPAEHLGRIFERFQRVDSSETREIQGSGLGLYIVRHLVELHGGWIAVESEPGRGSTFRFTLPDALPATKGVDPAGVGATP